MKSAQVGLKHLYDSYVRAVRWASDRVLGNECGGIVAYVTNGGFIDSKTFDGFRKTLAREFHTVHVYNLRGNARTSGEQARREGVGVFEGSRAGAAILLLAKRPGPVPRIRRGDPLPRHRRLPRARAEAGDRRRLEPRRRRVGDDRPQRARGLDPPAQRAVPRAAPARERAQPGVRRAAVARHGVPRPRHQQGRMGLQLVGADAARPRREGGLVLQRTGRSAGQGSRRARSRSPQIQVGPKTERIVQRRLRVAVNAGGFRTAVYRPFFRQHLYLDEVLNNSPGQLPSIFPSPETRTPAIVVEEQASHAGENPRHPRGRRHPRCPSGPGRRVRLSLATSTTTRRRTRDRGNSPFAPRSPAPSKTAPAIAARQHHRRGPRRIPCPLRGGRDGGRCLRLRLRGAALAGVPRALRDRPREDAAAHPRGRDGPGVPRVRRGGATAARSAHRVRGGGAVPAARGVAARRAGGRRALARGEDALGRARAQRPTAAPSSSANG